MRSIEFLKPTTLKLVLALVFFFLLISVLNFFISLCGPDINSLGMPRLNGQGLVTEPSYPHPPPTLSEDPWRYFCTHYQLLISKATILSSLFWAACVIIPYLLSCLTLLIAHKVTNQKEK